MITYSKHFNCCSVTGTLSWLLSTLSKLNTNAYNMNKKLLVYKQNWKDADKGYSLVTCQRISWVSAKMILRFFLLRLVNRKVHFAFIENNYDNLAFNYPNTQYSVLTNTIPTIRVKGWQDSMIFKWLVIEFKEYVINLHEALVMLLMKLGFYQLIWWS